MKKFSEKFPVLSSEVYAAALAFPFPERADMVIDTDIANELDDQYALALALTSPERINLRAVTAAPFVHTREENPAGGMRSSVVEARRQLDCFGFPELPVYPGAERFLASAAAPVDSPAARRIIELAREAAQNGRRLYVVGIAAATNIASALLLAPEIAESITVVWLGGHAPWCRDAAEFNLLQDVAAARVLLGSGVPLVLVPCHGVAELLGTSLAELKTLAAPAGAAGTFLYDRAFAVMDGKMAGYRILWDVAAVALFVTPQSLLSTVEPAMVLDDKIRFIPGSGGGSIRLVRYLYRDEIFAELFGRLKAVFGRESQ